MPRSWSPYFCFVWVCYFATQDGFIDLVVLIEKKRVVCISTVSLYDRDDHGPMSNDYEVKQSCIPCCVVYMVDILRLRRSPKNQIVREG